MTAIRERHIFRSAYNPAVGTAKATVWPKNTLYVFPTVASVMSLYSTSVADVGQLVFIEGLDADYNEISEVLALNGQAGRATVNSYFRINNLTVLVDNIQGDIALGTGLALLGVPANTYGFIPQGDNMDATGVYTVPNGWTLNLMMGSISAGGSSGSQAITADFRSILNGVNYLTAKIVLANSFQPYPYNPELEIPSKTDIYTNVNTSSNTALVAVTFNGMLNKNSLAN
jgi:hypothetical protein